MNNPFDINKNDIVSIVGSAGKTTLMYSLGRNLKKNNRVLLTTSTKILMPTVLNNDEEFIFYEDFLKLKNLDKNLYIIGKPFKNKKIDGITETELEYIKYNFDIVIIEADGSKTLKLKAWRDYEPVVYNHTTKVIGIIPFDMYNKELKEEDVFNYYLFKERFSRTSILDIDTLKNIIRDSKGIFKDSKGEKMLYLNRVKRSETEDLLKLVEQIYVPGIRFFYGDTLEGEINEYKCNNNG